MPTTYADPPPALVCDPTGLQYQMEKQLGRGGFAICWQAQQVDTTHGSRKTVAMKIVKSKMETKKMAQKFVTELQLHSKLHHPNIVAFHQAFAFQSSTYVVLELCSNGSLADWLKKRSYLSMPEVRRCIIQTCGAMKYLHMRNIVHRDLKAGNLFLDHNMNIKVGDFGLAAVLVSLDDVAVRRTTMCGTLNYIAPEVLEKSGKGHNERVDIWAIGILAYTLAVGRAPFHASKPDQVLLRVAKGEYAWPDLGKHQNDIPDDLRKLVSQILVDEDLRPSLDSIVSHDFFKLGYLPDILSESVLTSIPKWAVKPPSPMTIKRGYTEAWYKQCKASGVGEYDLGKFFSVVGDFPSSSIYQECEREAESGKMPVVPMPQGAIYVPFVCKTGKGNTGGLENIKEREVSDVSSPLIEASVSTKYNITNAVEPVLSKQGGIERHDRNTIVFSRTRVPAFSHAGSTEAARRPAVSNLKRNAKDTSVAVAKPEAGKSIAQLKPTTTEQLPIRLSRTPLVRATSRTSSHDIREKAGVTKAVPSTRSTSRTTTQALSTRAATIGHNAPQPTRPGFKSAPPPLPSANGIPTRSRDLIASNKAHRSLYIDPSTILTQAEALRNNIITALASGYKSSSTFCDSRPITDHLPFVCKWIDYSRKHGIGYVLAAGSVGMIANHTDDMPIMHTVVEHGSKYFKTTYDGFAVKAVPFTFLMQAGDGSLEEVTMTDAVRKQYTTLWAKFARYMCKQLNKQTTGPSKEETEQPTTIVRFYQRVGNVSIWGFSDGCFQFNFPDHTKIVLSADGTHASFTVLPLSAIKHINTDPTDLPFDLIEGREVVSGTVDQLLYGAQPTVNLTSKSTSSSSEIDVLALTAANALPDKLRFIIKVIGYWISGGGLGCKPAGTKWLVWEGTTLNDAGGSKLDWVTVGRFGGDKRSGGE
ncbi:kinase-like protein [Melanomma pulvis-pyrius CBS 109.77]|uniref:Kinase-like protein n=1 Tax=Melanomma pulvis-pyrius CBS 109.77 TaxID=1314802 RepID=A0A6A6XQG7_9PLEO|nr:kinase-like protein [Melanomma pulvis-pyrius CBS 109.77]